MGLEALGYDDAASEFESALRPLCTDSEIATIRATVGQKLVELGEYELGKTELLLAASDAAVIPIETQNAAAYRLQIVQSFQFARAVLPKGSLDAPGDLILPVDSPEFFMQPPAALVAFLRSNFCGTYFDLRTAADQPARPDGVLRTAALAIERVEAPHISNVREVIKQMISIADAAPVTDGDSACASLQSLLSVRNFALRSDDAQSEREIFRCCEALCERMERIKGLGGPDLEAPVEAWIILAKACRWPDEFRDDGERFLSRAASIANTAPPVQHDRLVARVAAGYARFGFFKRAREMAKISGPPEHTLAAKEMLANEYERRILSSAIEPRTAIVDHMSRITKAFDEQIDPDRRVTGYPR